MNIYIEIYVLGLARVQGCSPTNNFSNYNRLICQLKSCTKNIYLATYRRRKKHSRGVDLGHTSPAENKKKFKLIIHS